MTAEAWVYRFGDVEVEPAAHRITRGGIDLSVEPKAYAVLVALLQEHGRALQRDELLDRVWGHRHVTPGVLNRVVAQLRKALGDDAEHPRYIQTLHSLGYRFIGDVSRVPAQAVDAQATAAAGEDAHAARGERSARPAIPMSKGKLLAIAMAGIAIVVLAWYLRSQVTSRPLQASVAVLPFTSLSSDRDDSYFAEGLAVEMHDALAGVEGLKVAAQMSPGARNTRATDVKALGSALGVATVLDASVRRNGSRVRISARLSDTATGFTLWSHTYDRQMSDVFATQSEIAKEVVESLMGVLPGRSEALAKRLTPTRNVAAYDAYLKGLQQLRRADADGDARHAISFFSKALAADAGFARAQAGICLSQLRRFESVRDVDAYRRAHAACMRASGMDPALREVSLALAEMHRVRGEFGKAVAYYDKALQAPSLRPAAYVGMAKVQAAQGRGDLALRYFEQARVLSPLDYRIYRDIGYQHYLDGHLQDAIAAYRKATELQPGDARLWGSLGGLYLTAGDRARAGDAFERSIGIKPSDTALSNYGTLKYQAGDYVAAADLFRRATLLEPGDFRLVGNLGEALMAKPETAAGARESFARAAAMAERYVQIKPDDALALALLAFYRACLGDTAAARELIRRAEAVGAEPGEVAFRNAQTLVLLGDADGARQYLDRARRAGVAENRVAISPLLRRFSVIGEAERRTRQ